MGFLVSARKLKKITDFASKTPKSEKKPSEEEFKSNNESIEIEELLRTRVRREKIEEKPPTTTTRSIEEQKQPTKIQATETPSSINNTLEKLLLLAREAASRLQVEFLECDKQGNCNDGRRIGEVFEDSRGVKWQRGFLVTSRLPIFLNFIAEDSKIVGRIGKAFIIETAHGAKTIIPEDYICEMTSRYGVILNIEKCSNYKTSPWSERGGKSKKRS